MTNHESAAAHVAGSALYTDDLLPRFPGLLHAWPVMAPHAHARLTELNVEAARSAPGVVAVLTGDDAPGEGNTGPVRHDEPMFPSEIMFHSQPVAWVLAETLEAARQAAAQVSAKYEPLPALVTIDDAMAAGSFHSAPFQLERGEAAAVLAQAPCLVKGELRIGGQEHFYLETQAALAWRDETGGVGVHSSTQHPAETQEIVARVLGLDRNQVTVECLRMGGAFGGKEVQANPYAAVAALGAWKTGRPVRVRLTRHLDMVLTGKRHPFLARFTAGFAADGRILGASIELFADAGWSLDLSEAIVGRAMFHVDNCYLIPHLAVTGFVCRTHKTSQTAFRGFGGPQGMVVIEEILDRGARQLGLDSHRVRELNFYREGDTTHYGQVVKDASRITTIWEQLKRTSRFEQRREGIAAYNAQSGESKRGLAITPVKFGISFTATLFNQAGALVLVYRDGSVQLNHGGTEMGQGLNTKIREIAARELGVDRSSIRLMPPRTDKIPNTSATAASAGTDLNGAAVAHACRQILATLRPVAAMLLGCAEADVVFREGRVEAAGCAVSKRFVDVVENAYRQRLPLFAAGFYRTPDIHYDPKTFRGRPFHYYAYGAAVSEVEVDAYTGQYRLLRADLLEDVGDSIAPLIDRGQMEGGFLQGVGWLTLEDLRWDAAGRLATASASTYKLPSWSEVPVELRVDFLERATEPGVIFGSKAVGEPPLMLAISVREALRDAIAAFGPGPVTVDSPLTPERVFFAIQAARERAALRG